MEAHTFSQDCMDSSTVVSNTLTGRNKRKEGMFQKNFKKNYLFHEILYWLIYWCYRGEQNSRLGLFTTKCWVVPFNLCNTFLCPICGNTHSDVCDILIYWYQENSCWYVDIKFTIMIGAWFDANTATIKFVSNGVSMLGVSYPCTQLSTYDSNKSLQTCDHHICFTYTTGSSALPDIYAQARGRVRKWYIYIYIYIYIHIYIYIYIYIYRSSSLSNFILKIFRAGGFLSSLSMPLLIYC